MRADRPSATARLIAQSLLLAVHDPALAPLLPHNDAELIEKQLRASGGCASVHALLARVRMSIIERCALPGLILHYIARKRWLEARTRAALAEGARQIIVLGAGFDTLGWRLVADFSEARVIELDHPATQAPKRRTLGDSSNFFLHAADFNSALPHEALSVMKEYTRDAPAVFIAEGLMMYLDETRVAQLLRGLSSIAGEGSRLLFSYLTPGPLERQFLVRAWLRLRGEPFKWAIAPGSLPEFLRACGWTFAGGADAAALRAGIPAPAGFAHTPLITAEHLAEARRTAR